jgi:hypothetical protein
LIGGTGVADSGTIQSKDPNSTKDYLWDWSQWLGDDTITTSTFLVSDGTLELTADTNTNKTATVWLSGGTEGATYEVTNRITTAGGRIDDRTMRLTVRTR